MHLSDTSVDNTLIKHLRQKNEIAVVVRVPHALNVRERL